MAEVDEFEQFRVKFLSTCPNLPPDRPFGFPHLVDLDKLNEETDRSEFHVMDGIATLLYNWKPWALSAFLDLSCSLFDFHRHEDHSSNLDTRITRKGSHVICGFLDEIGGWDLFVEFRVDKVTGQCEYIASGPGPKFADSEVEAEEIAGSGSLFGQGILLKGYWLERPELPATIKISIKT